MEVRVTAAAGAEVADTEPAPIGAVARSAVPSWFIAAVILLFSSRGTPPRGMVPVVLAKAPVVDAGIV